MRVGESGGGGGGGGGGGVVIKTRSLTLIKLFTSPSRYRGLRLRASWRHHGWASVG